MHLGYLKSSPGDPKVQLQLMATDIVGSHNAVSLLFAHTLPWTLHFFLLEICSSYRDLLTPHHITPVTYWRQRNRIIVIYIWKTFQNLCFHKHFFICIWVWNGRGNDHCSSFIDEGIASEMLGTHLKSHLTSSVLFTLGLILRNFVSIHLPEWVNIRGKRLNGSFMF